MKNAWNDARRQMTNMNANERKRNGRKFDLFYQMPDWMCVRDDPWCVQYSSKFHVVCCVLYVIYCFMIAQFIEPNEICDDVKREYEHQKWIPKSENEQNLYILFAICNILNLMDSYVCRTSKWSHIKMIIAYIRISKLSHRQKLMENSVSWFLIHLNSLSIPYSIRAFLIRFCFYGWMILLSNEIDEWIESSNTESPHYCIDYHSIHLFAINANVHLSFSMIDSIRFLQFSDVILIMIFMIVIYRYSFGYAMDGSTELAFISF